LVLSGDVVQIECTKAGTASGVFVDPKEIDTSYWKYLQGISYHHFKDYLKSFNAEEYFEELYPGIFKKLQACAAISIGEEEL